MRKIVAPIACALGLCLGSILALADTSGASEEPAAAAPAVQDSETSVFAQNAIYLGVDGLGVVNDNFNDGDGGLALRVGWRLHPNVALEAAFQYYHQFDVNGGWSGTLNVKPYLLTGRWQPFFVAGLGYLDDNSGGDFIMRFGAGLDACITEHWSLGPEIAYVVLPDSGDGFLTFAFGVTYKATKG